MEFGRENIENHRPTSSDVLQLSFFEPIVFEKVHAVTSVTTGIGFPFNSHPFHSSVIVADTFYFS
jgi:hypothetical protein